MNHLTSHIHHSHVIENNTLHVVGVLSNPMRYHSRYRLFREWYEEMKATPNVKVYVVECAFGDRHHEATDASDPTHLQLRSRQAIWHKENMLNLGFRHLVPRQAKYLCWSDTDIHFRDKHWAQETIHQLQHYNVVQPWQDCADLGFLGNILQHFQSFCYVHRLGVPKQCHPGQPYKYAHTGFAWACTRKFYEAMKGAIGGPLMDWCIVGSADHHQAWGMIDRIDDSVHGKMPEPFKKMAREWAKAAYKVTHGHLGFVPTRIEHKFHGPKKRRQYRERWQIFIEHNFDPYTDLSYDEQGLVQIVGKPQLIEACANYLNSRHEDSIDNY